ncbi:MAG: TetR/AcrR family transcriptional regulator [Acidimicrobiales bacterium]
MPRPLSEEARQKATEAAQKLLAEDGIDGFTIDEVARRSGVAKTTIYRHWNSANELLVHTLDCQIERIQTPDTGTLRGDLLEMYTVVRGILNTPGTRQMFLDMASASARDSELETVKLAMLAERTRPIREILRRAIERGEIPDIDLEHASILIEGPFVARMFMSGEPVEAHETELAVDFIARGLGAPVN